MKIEKDKDGHTIVTVEAASKDPLLADFIKLYGEKSLKRCEEVKLMESKTSYVCHTLEPIDSIIKINKDHVPKGILEAIRETGFSNPEKLVEVCSEKVGKLKKGLLKLLNMTTEEAQALASYTSGAKEVSEGLFYRIINTALAERDKEKLTKMADYILYLVSSLHKLPEYKMKEGGALYRGVPDKDFPVHSMYHEGEELVWKSFASASTEKECAYKFIERGKEKKGTIFEIHGKFRGYSISVFSMYSKEEGKTTTTTTTTVTLLWKQTTTITHFFRGIT